MSWGETMGQVWARGAAALAAAALVAAEPATKTGDELFAVGDFAAASAAYEREALAAPDNVHARLGEALTAYYGNRLDAAEAAARRALLAPETAPALPSSGVTLRFQDDRTSMPIVRVKVNGRLANMVVNTGAGDLVLDPAFAGELGLRPETVDGAPQIKVAELDAASAVLRDQVARLAPTRAPQLPRWRQVDGVLGMAFLAHFVSTIDYPESLLRLQPRGSRGSALEEFGDKVYVAETPFWWVGDHNLVTRGSVNRLEGQLLLIGTGGLGIGFAPDAETVKSAEILTRPNRLTSLAGPGGAVSIPTLTKALCLGFAVCQSNVEGLYSPDRSTAGAYPFRIAGVVSDAYLSAYAVTIDVDRMRLVLRRPPANVKQAFGPAPRPPM
jgi:predicted aspartyl protease